MQTAITTQRLVLNIITEEEDDFMRSLVNTEVKTHLLLRGGIFSYCFFQVFER